MPLNKEIKSNQKWTGIVAYPFVIFHKMVWFGPFKYLKDGWSVLEMEQGLTLHIYIHVANEKRER